MITCIDSLMEELTFFIFRDNGIEVKISTKDNNLNSNYELSEEENEYVKDNLLQKTYQSKINLRTKRKYTRKCTSN
jgi:hypothetical protein